MVVVAVEVTVLEVWEGFSGWDRVEEEEEKNEEEEEREDEEREDDEEEESAAGLLAGPGPEESKPTSESDSATLLRSD